jgi:PEGA domain
MLQRGLSIVVKPQGHLLRSGWLLGAGLLSMLSHVASAQPAPARVLTPLIAAEAGLHDQTQRVVLLAPNIDAHWYAELRAALAGIGVRAESVREAKLDAALEACGTFSCLERVARAARGRVALVSISSASDGSRMLLLALVEADGGSAQNRARIGPGGIAPALLSAWQDASLAISLDGDAMIHAQSRPAGATVWLDGTPVGSTPFARQVPPGKHRVLLQLDGFIAQEQAIEARAGRAERVEITLYREPTYDTPAPADAAAPRSVWNYVLGGTLMLVAIPALVGSINTLVNDGQCLKVHSSDATGCEHQANFGNQSAITLTLGVVAFSAGGTIFFAQPIP